MVADTSAVLFAENLALRARQEELQRRLDEAEQALEAIRSGQVESLVVEGPDGPRIFSLVESEHSYRALVEAMNEGAATLSEGGVILYCNLRFSSLVQEPLERTIGSSMQAHVHPRSRVAFGEFLKRALESDVREEMTLRGPSGVEIPVYLSASAIISEGRRRYCIVATDLREQKRGEAAVAAERAAREAAEKSAQEQLMLSDRMASVGMLAAGLAHEINNPLASVMGNLHLVAEALAQGAGALSPTEFEEVGDEVRDASASAERIRDIVADLKIFSRPREDRLGPVDVRQVMESTLRMAWNEVRHRAHLVKNYGDTGRVKASESRLGQVFLNLVVNAAQAIAEGRADRNEIRISTRSREDGYVVVEVADTGPGIPPESLGRIFTPFYTTKPVGAGTGLGLAICRRIVTELGGTIDVESEVGKGTVIRVALPPAHERAPVEAPATRRTDKARRRARVLVVDDEPMIRRLVERALAEHEVVALGSAELALRHLREGEHFDVVLCDLMMPQMTGMDLYAELLRIDRRQAERMVFMTGGAFTPSARSFLQEVDNVRIAKPFEASELRGLIGDVLK
jgi:PAS domain S-box-containing protein